MFKTYWKSGKNHCKMKLDATVISDILYAFGQGNLTFIREKSGHFDKLWMWKKNDCYYLRARLGENLFYMYIKSLYMRGLREDPKNKAFSSLLTLVCKSIGFISMRSAKIVNDVSYELWNKFWSAQFAEYLMYLKSLYSRKGSSKIFSVWIPRECVLSKQGAGPSWVSTTCAHVAGKLVT